MQHAAEEKQKLEAQYDLQFQEYFKALTAKCEEEVRNAESRGSHAAAEFNQAFLQQQQELTKQIVAQEEARRAEVAQMQALLQAEKGKSETAQVEVQAIRLQVQQQVQPTLAQNQEVINALNQQVAVLQAERVANSVVRPAPVAPAPTVDVQAIVQSAQNAVMQQLQPMFAQSQETINTLNQQVAAIQEERDQLAKEMFVLRSQIGMGSQQVLAGIPEGFPINSGGSSQSPVVATGADGSGKNRSRDNKERKEKNNKGNDDPAPTPSNPGPPPPPPGGNPDGNPGGGGGGGGSGGGWPPPPPLPVGIPMGTPEEVVAAAMDQVIRVERKMLILPLRRRMSRSKAKRKKWTRLWLPRFPRPGT
jgi:hypothetical protein